MHEPTSTEPKPLERTSAPDEAHAYLLGYLTPEKMDAFVFRHLGNPKSTIAPLLDKWTAQHRNSVQICDFIQKFLASPYFRKEFAAKWTYESGPSWPPERTPNDALNETVVNTLAETSTRIQMSLNRGAQQPFDRNLTPPQLTELDDHIKLATEFFRMQFGRTPD